jgi:hypothetical protein
MSFMQMHPYCCFDCFLYSSALFNSVIFDINWIEFSMHLDHWTLTIIVGECFCIKRSTSYDEF